MSTIDLSRRDFIRWAGLAGGTAVIAACAKPAGPAATEPPPPTVDTKATEAAAAAQTAEAEIAIKAKEDEEAKAILEMDADQFNAYLEENKAKAVAEGKTVIEFLSAYGTIIEDKTQPHIWIMRDFMARNPNIYVEYSPSSAYTGGFNEVIMMRIASGTPPDAILHYSSPVAYAARGTCLALDDLLAAHPVCNKQTIVESTWAAVTWKGETFGVPINGSMAAMFYNTSILKDHGLPTERDKLPKTLDELRAMSAKVVQYENDVLTMGGNTPWNVAFAWAWPSAMVANGGSLWDGEKYTINDPKNAELIQYWLDWIDEMYGGDIDKLNAQGTFASAYPGSLFANKAQAFTEEGIWALTHYPPEIELEIGPMPIGLSGSRPATSNWPNLMFIPTGAKHVQEAFELIAYYATEGQIEWWNRWSDVPYWTEFPADVAPQDLIARVGEEKALEFTKFAREYANEIVIQWNSPIEDLANDEIFRAVDQALHRQMEPQAALDQAQDIVQAKLDEMLTTA